MDIFYPYRVFKDLLREQAECARRYCNDVPEAGLQNSLVFMVDGSRGHGGLLDRFKGAISSYALCKAIGKEFRINWTYPFRLENYLLPNAYDWRLRERELVFDVRKSCPKIFMGDTLPYRLAFLKNEHRQIHLFYNYDAVDWVNKRYGTSFSWKQLFEELFLPTKNLRERVDFYCSQWGNDFIAVHLRFQHLLGGSFKEVRAKRLAPKEALKLKNLALNTIEKIAEANSNKKVFVAGDNTDFLKEATGTIPNVVSVEGESIHCDNVIGGLADDATMKLLADFFLLSKAQAVYSIKSKEMYPSAFPQYAALLGEKKFERTFI